MGFFLLKFSGVKIFASLGRDTQPLLELYIGLGVEWLKVINVSAFEKHAGSSNRHPSDFIFIENGKCLRDILKAGWNAGEKKLNVLEVIKAAIGEIISSNNRKRKPCFKCGSRDGRLVSCARGGCSNTFHQGSTPSCFACFKLLMFLGWQ